MRAPRASPGRRLTALVALLPRRRLDAVLCVTGAGDRDIVSIPAEYEAVHDRLAEAHDVFVFGTARAALEKLGYRFEPVRLFDVRVPEYLSYVRRFAPRQAAITLW